MSWTKVWPDITKSVSDNGPNGVANTAYVETTLNLDHFWNIDGTKDGHHQFVQTEATNTADSSLETNASLAAAMNLVYFSRFKTATESVTQQDVQPYASNKDNTGVMQLLGIRACVLFSIDGSTGVATILYKHNVSSITGTTPYTVVFDHQLPSKDYMVLAGGIGDANGLPMYAGAVRPLSSKTVSSCLISYSSKAQPWQMWAVMFGG